LGHIVSDQADPSDRNPMRGRDPEYEAILRLLAGMAGGQGKILLVEGEPGAGKSLLLSAVSATAAATRSVGTVLTRLEGLTAAGPVLVTVDDVQWADQQTVHALRSMPRCWPPTWCPGAARGGGPGRPEQ